MKTILETKMVEFDLKIHPEQRVGYFQRELFDQFGPHLKILADARAFVAYRNGEDPGNVIRSLKVIIQDLEFRAYLQETDSKIASDGNDQDGSLTQTKKMET